MLANFHTHPTFCDGKNTPEELVLSAIQKGLSFPFGKLNEPTNETMQRLAVLLL